VIAGLSLVRAVISSGLVFLAISSNPWENVRKRSRVVDSG